MGQYTTGTTFRLLTDDPGDTSWMRDAECNRIHPDTGKPLYDSELWFPAGTTGPAAVQAETAKGVCRRCPVREACAEWALAVQEYGVAGGMDEEDRRSERRARARERRSQAGASA